jgi:hypothetical protein
LLLPADEVLHRLEEGHVDFELAVRHLLLDSLIQYVAEAARHQDRDARIFLHELLGAVLMRRGRTAGIEQRLIELGLFIELIECLGARACESACKKDPFSG